MLPFFLFDAKFSALTATPRSSRLPFMAEYEHGSKHWLDHSFSALRLTECSHSPTLQDSYHICQDPSILNLCNSTLLTIKNGILDTESGMKIEVLSLSLPHPPEMRMNPVFA